MEIIIRKTIKSGNASAVVLPKSWLNKNVKVELADKSLDIILNEVLEIVKHNIDISEIIGIYLVGSYARGEQTNSSDIDILIITEETSKTIKKDYYEILLVSLDLLKYKLEKNLLPIGTMLMEAKPLLNNNFIKSVNIEVTRKNVKWFLDTTLDRLKIVKESIDRIERKKPEGKLDDKIAYILVLRLRTLYMIECLILNKQYKKSDFISLVNNIASSHVAYERYTHVKDNNESKRLLPISEGKRLYEYLDKLLKDVEKEVKLK